MDRLEALADAIGYMNGMSDPDSEAYQLRNPGLLHALSLTRLQTMDDKGVRNFRKLEGGYKALVEDLKVKCGGKSRSKLTPDNALQDLLPLYGLKTKMAIDKALRFMRVALKENRLHGGTPICWFLKIGEGSDVN